MEKWSIEPAPSKQQPDRRQLFVQGEMADIMKVVKKFGAHCGRPRRLKDSEGFNFALYLNGLSPNRLDTLRALLADLAPPAAAAPPAADPGAIPGFGPEFAPPAADPGAIPGLGPEFAPPAADPGAIPGLGPEFAPPAADPGAIPGLGPEFAPPVPDPGAIPVFTPEAPPSPEDLSPEPLPPGLDVTVITPASSPEQPSELIPLTPEAEAVTQPSMTQGPPVSDAAATNFPPPQDDLTVARPPAGRRAGLDPVGESVGVEGPPAQSPPTVPGAPAQASAGAVPAEPAATGLVEPGTYKTPLDAVRNFDNLLVGSFNRFAHAAATSVISSPGSMYNPLFIYGGPGVGKTHMLHAIGLGLEKELGGGSVIFTSGARLSYAVESLSATGRFGEIESEITKAKAILIDDIHLLAVSDANQAPLTKIFAKFFGAGEQVVLASLYPAKALGSLEEALKISFGNGWSVDMKIPNQEVQMDMIMAGCERYGVRFSKDEVSLFREKLDANYPESALWIKRLLILRQLTDQTGKPLTFDKLLGMLFAMDVINEGQDIPSAQEVEASRSFSPPPGGEVPLAVLVPKGHEAMGSFLHSKFHGVTPPGNTPQTYKCVLLSSYDSEQPFGVPFQIGKICGGAGARAALILGPPRASGLAARAGEFSHAVAHILRSLDIPMSWIPYNGTLSSNNMLRAHLDFLPVPAAPPPGNPTL